MQLLRPFLGILVLLSSVLPALGQDPDAEDVMRRLRSRFDKNGALSAHFRQTLDADYAGSSASLEGTIVLSGIRYRIETEGQTFITDGTTTWVYVAEDQQVIVDDYVEDDATFTPGHFLDDRAERYVVSFADEQSDRDHVVRLRARSADTFLESATLWVDRNDYLVSRIEVVDVNGAFMRFEMDDIDLDPDIDESTFRFEPRPDIEVVDLR